MGKISFSVSPAFRQILMQPASDLCNYVAEIFARIENKFYSSRIKKRIADILVKQLSNKARMI